MYEKHSKGLKSGFIRNLDERLSGFCGHLSHKLATRKGCFVAVKQAETSKNQILNIWNPGDDEVSEI